MMLHALDKEPRATPLSPRRARRPTLIETAGERRADPRGDLCRGRARQKLPNAPALHRQSLPTFGDLSHGLRIRNIRTTIFGQNETPRGRAGRREFVKAPSGFSPVRSARARGLGALRRCSVALPRSPGSRACRVAASYRADWSANRVSALPFHDRRPVARPLYFIEPTTKGTHGRGKARNASFVRGACPSLWFLCDRKEGMPMKA